MANLIVVPTRLEFDALVGSFSTDARCEEIRDKHLRMVRFEALSLFVALGGLGKAQFGVQTQYLLGIERWDLVICAGAAGALSDDVDVGDIVVGTETVEHDIRKTGRDLMPSFAAAPIALERARELRSSVKGFRVHLGRIASGDEDVVTHLRRQAVQRRTGALAVAWEGAGGARACRFSAVPFVEVRAVADRANPFGPTDFRANLEAAMNNLGQVLRSMA